MVFRETDLPEEGERLRSELAQAEVEPELDAYLKALGICQNLMLYSKGQKDYFRAYFVKVVPEQASIERHVRRTLKIPNDLPVSDEPQAVMEIDDICLYRWSSSVDNSEFDIFYEACPLGEVPVYFKQAQEAATEAAEV